MAVVKLGAILGLIALFFGLFVFGPLYHSPFVQVWVLLAVAAWHTARASGRATLALLKFCLPFLLSLLAFGLLFHFLRLMGREDWLEDTLIKCLIFPSSLIFLKVVLTYLTYLDILNLPLSMKKRIDLITVKSAFQKGGHVLQRFSWYLNTYTCLQGSGRIRYEVRKYACLIIALYLYLYEEIDSSHRLLQNRYHHLDEDPK